MVQNKSAGQIELEALWLDFFPSPAEVGPMKESRTRLVAPKGETFHCTQHHDVRSYVECDCACK